VRKRRYECREDPIPEESESHEDSGILSRIDTLNSSFTNWSLWTINWFYFHALSYQSSIHFFYQILTLKRLNDLKTHWIHLNYHFLCLALWSLARRTNNRLFICWDLTLKSFSCSIKRVNIEFRSLVFISVYLNLRNLYCSLKLMSIYLLWTDVFDVEKLEFRSSLIVSMIYSRERSSIRCFKSNLWRRS
jgi:hypothetical protein